jgi:hypothetical protein
MTRRIFLFSILFILLAAFTVFGNPSVDPLAPNMRKGEFQYIPRITEEEIPMPAVQYELPETLVGEFVMVSSYVDHYVTIFPNNKYILVYDLYAHVPFVIYGHIVNVNDTWYFSPILDRVGKYNGYYNNYDYFDDLVEINLTDSGFSYNTKLGGFYTSMRKEKMPLLEHLADDISVVPGKRTKQQYFLIEGNKIDFIYHRYLIDGIYYDLIIENGIVNIIVGGITIYRGFLEKTYESTDIVKGVIRFTNGIPYYYIKDGTAEIEINSNGRIVITIIYTPDIQNFELPEMYKGLQFPAKLVLEF